MKRLGGTHFSDKLNNVLYFFSGAFTVVIVGILIIGVQIKAQNTHQGFETPSEAAESEYTPSGIVLPMEETVFDRSVEKWQEGIVTRHGRHYKFNSDIKTYLLMGIDCDDKIQEMDYSKSGGQSDAIFLLVANGQTNELSVISINRNTMTEVSMFTGKGTSMGTTVAQLCVQHSYGDGKKLSGSRTVDAVEKLFYNLPVSGYISLNMGAIPDMNDAIGGIEVEVLSDLDYPSSGVHLNKGEVVTLQGQEAYCYLRGRDLNDFDSATDRLRRQEQYISAYMNKLKRNNSIDAGTVFSIYNAVAEYVVSSISFTDLCLELMKFDFNDKIRTVPGTTVPGESGLEEFYVDEDAFCDLLIEVFYNEITP